MNFDPETLKGQIPQYLSADDKRVLLNELSAISQGGDAEYILSSYRDEFENQMLQGDGWSGFVLFSYDTGERRSVPGIVLSNTCDLDPDNPRDLPTKVVFAPIARLTKFIGFLEASGIDRSRIDSKIDDIRAQRTTSIFYLPAGAFLDHDYVVRLDEAQSMPVSVFNENCQKSKLFTLSNTGFYMLVLKLSIHFCRLREHVMR